MSTKKKLRTGRSEETNIICGNGLFTFLNGDKYSGEYLADLKTRNIIKQGEGTYKTLGHSYYGIWENDKLLDTQETKITFPDNSVYIGYVSNQEFIEGTFKFFDGSRLIGRFVNNKPTFETVFTDRNNRVWSSTENGDYLVLKYPNLHRIQIINFETDSN